MLSTAEPRRRDTSFMVADDDADDDTTATADTDVAADRSHTPSPPPTSPPPPPAPPTTPPQPTDDRRRRHVREPVFEAIVRARPLPGGNSGRAKRYFHRTTPGEVLRSVRAKPSDNCRDTVIKGPATNHYGQAVISVPPPPPSMSGKNRVL